MGSHGREISSVRSGVGHLTGVEMIKTGDRVTILRAPTTQEDPDGAWLPEFGAFLSSHGTVLEDDCPYAQDSIYAYVEVDDYADFYLPAAVLTKL